ncbi:hypothetical protein DOY81_009860 [Sarcophaga bullata]|nr:hypothetical protein DOY81_009860 [Sarcophaga bullata]
MLSICGGYDDVVAVGIGVGVGVENSISGLSPFMGETDIETMANVTIAKYDFEDESFAIHPHDSCPMFRNTNGFKDVQKSTQSVTQAFKSATSAIKSQHTITHTANIDDNDEDIDELTGQTKELDTTKDNLKNFIERWEEHPNSPYVFDVEGNVIAPLSETEYKKSHATDSISSSRVCSPSPCESLDTITDDETATLPCTNDSDEPPTPINESREKLFPASASGSATPTPQSFNFAYPFGSKVDEFNGSGLNLQQRSIKSYLHTFDRRNSDTNYLLGRRASGERVNLADEIKKLSDHLLMLAEINNKFSRENQSTKAQESSESTVKETATKSKKTKETGAEKKTSTKTSTSVKKDSSVTSSSSSSNRTKVSSNTTTTTSVTSSSFTTTSSSSNFFSNLNPGKSRTSTLTWRLQQSIEETPKLSSTTKTKTSVSTVSTGNTKTSSVERKVAEAASIKRAKFRINQMSRDVPIGLPDTHQSVNLEEAANNTKDCLLHLLEKYNDTKTRNPLGRHQSISVDCNVRDNLEYRSMSSINAFFQRHNNNGEMVKQLQAQLKEKTGES